MNQDLPEDPSSQGYIYILWNEMYTLYGEHVYKIGSTNDFNRRMDSYTTSYIKPCEFKHISEKIQNYKVIEKIIHFELNDYRISSKREFFNCTLDTAISIINKVSNYTEDDIQNVLNLKQSLLQKLKAKQNNLYVYLLNNYTQLTPQDYQSILQADDISFQDCIQLSKKNASKVTQEDKYKFIRKLLTYPNIDSDNPLTIESIPVILNSLFCSSTKQEQINDIIKSEDITEQEYIQLYTKGVNVTSKKEKDKLLKYVCLHVYKNITEDFLLKNLSFIEGFITILPIRDCPIDDSIAYARNNNVIFQENNKEQSELFRKKVDNNWRKVEIALHIIKIAGFTSLNDTNQRKVDWIKVEDYIIENEEEIRVLWSIEKYKAGRNTEEDDSDEEQKVRKVNKRTLVKYVQNKIEFVIGMTMKSTYVGSKSYTLQIK